MSPHPPDYSHALQVPSRKAAGAGADQLLQSVAEPEPVCVPVGPLAGQRIDRALAQALPGVSRTRIQRWMALGAVLVAGAPVCPSYRLRGIESIEVTPLPTEAEGAFEPDPMSLTVLYEDEHLLVVDKPAGLVTHPAPGHWRGTLMNGILYARPDSARLPRAGIVHRLDRDTSGLLMVARSEAAFAALTAALAARQISRQYLAVTEGVVAAPWRIDAPIGRDPRDRLRMAVVAQGKPAVTHVQPLASTRSASAVQCRLETGRTHQIRVHLAHRGHPLMSDRTYGGTVREACPRQALHAWRLSLTHPVTGQSVSVVAHLPPDLSALNVQLGLPDWAALVSEKAS